MRLSDEVEEVLARGHEREWIFRMDLCSFGALYDSIMRNKARELEDHAWAMHFAAQASTKDFKGYVQTRFGEVLNPGAEKNDLQKALRELGGGA